MNLTLLHKDIIKDLNENRSILHLKKHTYTHKYRGNEDNDVNVSYIEGNNGNLYIKVFLNNSDTYINHMVKVNKKELKTIWEINKKGIYKRIFKYLSKWK